MGKRTRRTAAFPRQEHDHARCVADALASANALCARTGDRLTPLRRRVLELVWSGHRPLGAYAMLDRLRDDGRSAAPPTVYRALDFLLARGLIHRLASLNAYCGCAHPGEAHLVQFLICRDCGTAAEIADREVGEAIAHSAAAHGFEISDRVVELSGRCRSCRTASKARHAA